MKRGLPPIPSDGRLNLALRRAAEAATNATIIAKLALEPDTPKLQRPTRHIDPADTRTLRGIPAIGRGVAGATPGSSPHAIIDRT
jgi:hypothetical protein